MIKKKKSIIVVVSVLFFIIIFSSIRSSKSKVPLVTIEKAQKRKLIERVTATGEIKPKKSINISTDVPGKILKVFVREGDPVKKNQLLLKIDSTMYEASAERDREIISSAEADLISQEANLKKATQFFNRRKQLYEEGIYSREQFEEARIQLEIAQATRQSNIHRIQQARASLKSSLDNIQKTSIVSPIEGIVTSLKVEEGEVAIIGTMNNNPGTVLMTIADLSVMEAEVKVDETDIVKVRIGKKAEVKVDAIPNLVIIGSVTEIGNSALIPIGTATAQSTEARDFKTVITLISPPPELKPGFSATVDIIIDERVQSLSIPIAALVIQEDQNSSQSEKKKEREGVFLSDKGIARFREVKKGIAGDMYIEILSGLNENDIIITGPFAMLKKLKENDRIKSDKEKSKNDKHN